MGAYEASSLINKILYFTTIEENYPVSVPDVDELQLVSDMILDDIAHIVSNDKTHRQRHRGKGVNRGIVERSVADRWKIGYSEQRNTDFYANNGGDGGFFPTGGL
jgi:hypothetical protein